MVMSSTQESIAESGDKGHRPTAHNVQSDL